METEKLCYKAELMPQEWKSSKLFGSSWHSSMLFTTLNYVKKNLRTETAGESLA